ncbi:acetoacetyl-CoA synthetase [Pseudonocardia thermophila]|jgi:acetoacetyl-CoA synthase|uniref:Acetoacetyl-CoA synthetase n=1 Tax=Pseudonocardia thermophila TaxID=1848 RepID=A0A1M6TPJ0_PSETH|nr:acetoacetate--CoA ligase [Pseudonocardia thermophila]SHK58902.1 acetoacetyl-CoA synthetase [Pseudonocardia thermophila]
MTTQRDLLWTPSDARRARANLTRYAHWLAEHRGLELPEYDYRALHRWSVEHLDAFYASLWEYFDITSDSGYDRVLGRREMPGAQWFPGARLNYAEHVFRGKADDALAVQYAAEGVPARSWTWGTLRERTAALAAGLREAGVGVGDRVAAYLPNVPETLAAGLACMSIGAIWSACSPDFGVRSVVDRFAQIEPTVLLAVDGYTYSGKPFDRRAEVRALQDALPTVRTTVVLRALDPDADLSGLRDPVQWEEFGRPGAPLQFTRVPGEHPLWIVYSSGTTGLPKPIVHSHVGMLVDQLKASAFHLDAHRGDRMFWFTTTGWVMWNVMVGVLLTEASIIIYDGSPGHPDLGVLWDLAEDTGMTMFGTSASYIQSCMKAGIRPREGRELAALTALGSTGSALSPEGFDWVYGELGPDIWLGSISGGTDVAGPFLGPVPWLPVYRSELQAPILGVAVEAWDPQGRPLVGETGELVITEPMPSMPVSFWGDPDRSRYREAYFTTYPGVWRHGDWLEITEHGGGVLYGRSDATINRGGVRIGSAELYRAVLTLPEVTEALVVDLPEENGPGQVPMFVTLADGVELDDELVARIKDVVRRECSPRHVPDRVFAVAELPRTLTGKILEVPVKRLLMGADPDTVASRDSLANPAALDAFQQARTKILDALGLRA